MSFIAVLLALLLEQARPLARGNFVHASIRRWIRSCTRNLDAGQALHGWLAWCSAVCLPSFAAMLIYWLLHIFLGWAVAIVWSVAVLYATLGFRQFSFHFTEIREALAEGDELLARRLLANWQQIDVEELPRSEILRHVIEFSVLAAHRHVFGVLAWFSLLAALGFGPAGAVFYRLSEFVARYWRHRGGIHLQPISDALQAVAVRAWQAIDWLPARLTALSFAVVGSFEDAVEGWRAQSASPFACNDGVILAATAGAINVKLGAPFSSGVPPESPESPARPRPEQHHFAVVVGLVWRTVVMWMVLLALLTLARLLG